MMERNMSIVVFNMLPTSVQSRLPDLQSLRRSTSRSILPSRQRSITSQDDEPVVIARRDANAIVELQTCATASGVANNRLVEDKPKPSGPDGRVINASSGVKWRYARQGSFLQQSASQETSDLTFARKSYIDGVAYMLKALPDDMDECEVSIIHRALPKSCAQLDMNGQIKGDPGTFGWLPSDRAKTFLHSAVQGFVTGLVIFIYLLLSFFAIVIRAGAYYERQYNISQHIISSSFVFATTVGKQSGALSEKISAISEGKLGKAMSDLAAWTIESVAGGVQDGIGQGLQLIEQRQK
ncbi:uncharacterized protein F4817DRAFT_312644 [Daldinia loculata]|uniref:uncharacterized protein n=1 Tax=Daldinia loculata TaxID=103429 RepID=UPI0020C3861B|nr:uncharacterized protein F4817DRAFT_312644 [Daldinia loculata]KAI1650777.1 hypothetical protein F4817DRAFT_312644 [Daldinia loculata]